MPRLPRMRRAFKPCAVVFLLLFVAGWGRVLWWQFGVPAHSQEATANLTVPELLDLAEDVLETAESRWSEELAVNAFNLAMDAFNRSTSSGQKSRAMALRVRAEQTMSDIRRNPFRLRGRHRKEKLLLNIMLSITGVLLAAGVGWVCWRRFRKPPPGHCQRCGYNLHGLTEPRCPECGTGFDPDTLPDP